MQALRLDLITLTLLWLLNYIRPVLVGAFAPCAAVQLYLQPSSTSSSPVLLWSTTPTLTTASTTQQNDLSSLIPTVLHETDRILVINKPPGISHHSTFCRKNETDDRKPQIGQGSSTTQQHEEWEDDEQEQEEEGILALIRRIQEEKRPETNNCSNTNNISTFWNSTYTGRLYGVHRLDRVTSGILILAKDADMAKLLTAAFRNGNVSKYYTGISFKSPSSSSRGGKPKKQGWIQGGMERGRRKSWYLTRLSTTRGSTVKNFAKTRYFTKGLGNIGTHVQTEDHPDGGDLLRASPLPRTLLLMRPYTGRTHQLRVAAKSIGLPLAGDPVYSDSGGEHGCIGRTFLHATALHIPSAAMCTESDTSRVGPDPEDLTVLSPPNFEHYFWKGSEDAHHQFRAAFYDLFQKGCDCPPLLSALRNLMKTEMIENID